MKPHDNPQSWRFIHVADIHVGSPRSYRFQPAWNENWQTAREQILSRNPDLVLVGGDMTRDGTTHCYELEAIRDDLQEMPVPVHCIPGNHEVGNKFSPDSETAVQKTYIEQYAAVFGASQWSFLHKNVRFTGCDAFLLGSGLLQENALRNWLDAQRQDPEAIAHVWILHPALFADHPDEPDWDRHRDRNAWYFALDNEPRALLFETFRRIGVTHVITAHIHCRRHVRMDGMDIHFAPSTAFSQWGDRWPDGDPALGFLEFEVSGDGIQHRFVPLRRKSTRKGYGPGGNPSVAGRDYSVAWEQPAPDRKS